MKVLLNYGAGVNSTAMMLKCTEQKCWNQHEIHVVFSDTGCEHPETMEFIKDHAIPFCSQAGFKFVIVHGFREGEKRYPSLRNYCSHYKMIPSRRYRWCTVKFKIWPINQYAECRKFDLSLIGIDAGEEHRATEKDGTRYPLVEAGMDRQDCITIIKNAGMPVPRKSGCYICPFQRKDQWAFLRRDHPELFQIAVDLERASQKAHEKDFYLSSNKKLPLEEWLKDYQPKERADQARLFEPDKDMPCFCTT